MAASTAEDQCGDRRRSVLAGFMIGVAITAAVDTVVFHQVLAWHHFYDRSSLDVALLSDGILQAVYLVLLVAGFFLFADLRRSRAVVPAPAWGGFLVGSGTFQIFDGIVDHKVLRVHQIRYGVDDLTAYDLSWNLAGLVLLVAGAALLWRSRGGPVPTTRGQSRRS